MKALETPRFLAPKGCRKRREAQSVSETCRNQRICAERIKSNLGALSRLQKAYLEPMGHLLFKGNGHRSHLKSLIWKEDGHRLHPIEVVLKGDDHTIPLK